jgi:hypothetical protein
MINSVTNNVNLDAARTTLSPEDVTMLAKVLGVWHSVSSMNNPDFRAFRISCQNDAKIGKIRIIYQVYNE